MKHIFVVNPAAGKSDSTAEIEGVLKSLTEQIDYEVYTTTTPCDATAYVRSKCEEYKNEEEIRFYACGGDGTLNEVASGVIGSKNASVTVYPCGSGNDYVKYYGSAERFSDISELIKAKSVKVDMMKVNDKYCVNVCNFGFDTMVVKAMEKVKRKPVIGGKHSYTVGVATALCVAMKNKCKVYVNDEKLNDKDILLCTVANGKYVGGSFKCAPRSNNDDGLLDICLVKPISRFTFLALIGLYTEGKHLDAPKFSDVIIYRRAKKVTVDAPDGFCVTVDGELIYSNHFDIEVMPSAISFAVPGIEIEQNVEMQAVAQ